MKKRTLTSILMLVLMSAALMPAGCGSASDPGIKEEPEIKVETESEEAPLAEPEEEPPAKPEVGSETDRNTFAEKDSDDISGEDTESADKSEDDEALTDVSESETVASDYTDEWWPKYDTPEVVLDKYIETHDGALADDLGYLMYDVNADGYEELIITHQDRIAEIYGNYKGKLHRAFSTSDGCEAVLYPDGMLKVTAPDTSEYTEITWQQYFSDYGDFLPVYQEMNGEYYTFCAYDLNDTDMKEIDRSLEDIGDYPVWIGEWSDMITKKVYESLVPKTKPVKLLPADAFSDRSALEVKPETLLYVKASDGYANLRTGPGTEYSIICQMPNGDDMEVYRKDALSESGKKWLKVTYFTEADNEDGYTWLTGWVAESQLE